MAALDAEALRAALHGTYAAVDVVDSTGSTNADLVAAAGSAADRTVLIAEQQTAGRGRRARDWVSPPATGLYLSVLLRPEGVPVSRYGSLSLVAGVALIRTARHAGVIASLKWPNDLLAGVNMAKCAGVLAEATPNAVVVGVGLNVAALPGEVPVGPGGLPATSLAQEGGSGDRTEVAIALLRAFAEAERSWRGAQGDLVTSGLLTEYRGSCATLGQRIRVELPDGSNLQGLATDVDGEGRLVVDVNGTARTLSAGDVVHVRPGT
ncbi:biotin--[acetyl-CoA-carboxylase] ligase [Actinokineospora globicatena]|uniref:biotin--[biotin carboxyl-carrier protein] ligase n=1 Tax=Actinokineospora globicatena TaxID=103729 RepID=A0A9W6V9P7_9PSEU|nr:biotin--[acetyl-CoA-carboxylase] ligase [Actinokineospora globicatena]MCP2302063.1 BirA family transcriptional regulator, biotin operon repressor / biotin-[acetyl-CoA-carboxylase] ligase [Actinokineospora globicatena]GLW76275.1 biotin--[acetyl-CoA-carboxylase] ligase [Actinokineospora globicatena]GLW83111.1 biotin--[acetyl-CoA-carboxylase] ligase [Actinokineospora globicatena]GLW95390.1 biotin--[acetyl-CoA-carboxylase] ligase [Actinokineospora globicatena]